MILLSILAKEGKIFKSTIFLQNMPFLCKIMHSLEWYLPNHFINRMVGW
jgi:hypothetical protein